MTAARVLQMLTFDRAGGTERMGVTVFPRLDRSRFSVTVGFASEPGPIGRELTESGLEVLHFDGRPLRGLAAAARSGRFDIAHFYGYRIGMAGRSVFAALSPRTRRVLGVRHLYPYERFAREGVGSAGLDVLERAMAKLTHLYVANSQGAVERLATKGVPRHKLAYVPNGLDIQDWPVRPPGAHNDPPVVICVARLVPFKGHHNLLAAAARLHKKGVRFKLSLVGGGPLDAELRRRVLELGLSEVVEFRGELSGDEALSLLLDADVFALASSNEGMPRSVMEAMASGVPVVATDVNGTSDLVQDGVTGYLVPFGRAELFAQALEQLLTSFDLRIRFAEAARARLQREFSLEVTVNRLEACYAAQLQAHPEAAGSERAEPRSGGDFP